VTNDVRFPDQLPDDKPAPDATMHARQINVMDAPRHDMQYALCVDYTLLASASMTSRYHVKMPSP